MRLVMPPRSKTISAGVFNADNIFRVCTTFPPLLCAFFAAAVAYFSLRTRKSIISLLDNNNAERERERSCCTLRTAHYNNLCVCALCALSSGPLNLETDCRRHVAANFV